MLILMIILIIQKTFNGITYFHQIIIIIFYLN